MIEHILIGGAIYTVACFLIYPWAKRALMQSYRTRHMPTDGAGRTPRDYAVDQLLRDWGPDMNTWPNEVSVTFTRITRNNTDRRRSYYNFLQEMRSYGWMMPMQQNTLEEGATARFQRLPDCSHHPHLPRRLR